MFSDSTVVYLETVKVPLRLACTNPSGWPLVLSLWYLHRDGLLYCATQESARVVKYLIRNPNCGFEIAADTPPYCGVRGRARAEIVPEMGEDILHLLLERYLGGKTSRLARMLLKNVDREVAIRLKPVTCSIWDFSSRMAEFAENGVDKPCP